MSRGGIVIQVKNKKEFNQLIKKDKVLIDFFAVWCGPCQMMEDVLIELNAKHKDLTIIKVNIDKFNELGATYNVNYVPTFYYLKKGKIIKTVTGYHPLKSLERIIK